MRDPHHVIYGLFLADRPRRIVYVGSTTETGLVRRLQQHMAGQVPTTHKMARREGASLSDIRLHILRQWTTGMMTSPEGRAMRILKLFGMAKWNISGPGHVGPFSPEHKRALSLAHIGLKLSPSTKLQMSLRMRGNKLGLGHKHSEQWKANISAGTKGHRGHHWNAAEREHQSIARQGRRHSEDQILRISLGVRSALARPEVRQKISVCLMGNGNARGPHRPWTAEERKAISIRMKGKKNALGHVNNPTGRHGKRKR